MQRCTDQNRIGTNIWASSYVAQLVVLNKIEMILCYIGLDAESCNHHVFIAKPPKATRFTGRDLHQFVGKSWDYLSATTNTEADQGGMFSLEFAVYYLPSVLLSPTHLGVVQEGVSFTPGMM